MSPNAAGRERHEGSNVVVFEPLLMDPLFGHTHKHTYTPAYLDKYYTEI